jgi:hypothetical protein
MAPIVRPIVEDDIRLIAKRQPSKEIVIGLVADLNGDAIGAMLKAALQNVNANHLRGGEIVLPKTHGCPFPDANLDEDEVWFESVPLQERLVLDKVVVSMRRFICAVLLPEFVKRQSVLRCW